MNVFMKFHMWNVRDLLKRSEFLRQAFAAIQEVCIIWLQIPRKRDFISLKEFFGCFKVTTFCFQSFDLVMRLTFIWKGTLIIKIACSGVEKILMRFLNATYAISDYLNSQLLKRSISSISFQKNCWFRNVLFDASGTSRPFIYWSKNVIHGSCNMEPF